MPSKTYSAVVVALLCCLPKAGTTDEPKKDDEKPISGKTGKYNLEYESFKGKAEGEVFYRVRNQSGGILTPVLWKDDKTVLMDLMVPKCQENTECAWIESKQNYIESVKGLTDLYYGINQDEHKDDVRAWRKSRDAMAKIKPIETSIKGVIADKDEKVFDIDITVRCAIKEDVITYSFTTGRKGAPLGLRKVKGELTVIWRSAEGKAFNREVGQLKEHKLSDKPLLVNVGITDGIETKHGILEILVDSKKLASVTAPAYVPKE